MVVVVMGDGGPAWTDDVGGARKDHADEHEPECATKG